MINTTYILFLIFIAITTIGCSATRSLDEGELLYKRSKVTYENEDLVNKKARVSTDLLRLSRMKPNTGLFKIRLGIHNMVKPPKKEKGFRHWLKNKVGEPPSVYKDNLAFRTRLLMEKYLKDKGYFGSSVEYDTVVNGKKVTIDYRVTSKGQYKIADINRTADTTAIGRLFKTKENETTLRRGVFYNLQSLDAERLRLTELANNNGYFNFNTGYIYYFVDTALGTRQADIYIEIQPPGPNEEHKKFFLGKDYVYPGYKLNDPDAEEFADTSSSENIRVIRNNKLLRQGVYEHILSRQDSMYSKKVQDQTVNHFLNLGIFKFVSLKYDNGGRHNILDRQYFLTPDKLQDVTAELEINNRTGNYLGTAATLTYSHKNLFHGAERLSLRLSGGIETQLGNRESLINTADVNFQLDFQVPRFLVPFKRLRRPNPYVPSTKMSINTIFQRRTQFYTVSSSGVKFGYAWKRNPRISHEFFPLTANNLVLISTTPEFDSLLTDDPRLRSGFENAFVAGVDYTFTFSNQSLEKKRNYSFFRAGILTSGNVIYGFSRVFSGKRDKPLNWFGVPLSNFTKLTLDYRYYVFKGEAQFVFRVLAGTGFATGTSEIMPYNEQFFIGGSNSLRAFRLRELGPGSFVNPDNEEIIGNSDFFDQTGDIKLELNAEFRFPLISFLKGAVFVDAGNVWLAQPTGPPEGVFHLDRFYKEIAIGTGLGFRLDFDFLVIRLDGSFAIRRPYEDTGFEWAFDRINFGSPDWRKRNLIWNIAIGYPF